MAGYWEELRKKRLQEQKARGEVASKGAGETFRAIPSTMAGAPVDWAELAAMGAYYGVGKEPFASKFKKKRPPAPHEQPLKEENEFIPELIPGSSPWIHEKLGGDPTSPEFIGGSFLAGDLPWLKAASAMFGVGALAMPMSKRLSRADKLLEKGVPEDEILKKTGLVPANNKTGWRQPPETLALRTYGGGKTQLPREIQKQLMESDALSTLRMYLTEEELKSMTPEMIRSMEEMITTGKTPPSKDYPGGKPITITQGKEAVPSLGQEEIGALAYAGRHKKGWYKHSAQQLRNVFQDDTERFIALLAGTSPQTSVEMNMENALRIWKNWDAAGRPTEDAAIKKIMGQSVVGKGTEESVMDAWVNNSLTALKAEEPTEIVLSGPKANSFMTNLLEGYDEVTNDTWMGRAYNVLQDIFGGRTTVATEGKGAKGPGYLLSNAATRRAATFLEKKTGQKWTAAEVQETVWSYVKTIYEKRRKGPGTQKSMQELSKDITAEEIGEVVDFASLMSDPKYSNILKGTKYEKRLSSITPFQSEAEIGDLPSYRGREAAFGRALGGLESQFRETDSSRFIKTIRDKVNRSIVADRSGTGRVNRPFTRTDLRNPGRGLKGLGKVAQYNLSQADQKRLKSLGVSVPDFFEIPQTAEGGQRFHDFISESKKANVYGAAVYVYGPEEYQGMRMFLTKDGDAGFAVKGDDIVSVFNRKDSPHKRVTIPALMLAVQEGGRKLDAFDTALPQLYSKLGFRISSRTVWNDEFAPPEWDKELFQQYNKGEPDVVFMHYDPQSTEVYEQLAGTYDPDNAMRNALLRDEYGDAVALQSQNIAESDVRFQKGIQKAPWQIEEKGVVPFVKPGKQEKLMQRMYGESMAREALAGTQSGIGFTSPAMKTITGSKDASLKGKVWLNKLKGGGVPKEELEWTGLGEYLSAQGKTQVTKKELQEFMETNQIQIQEIVYGEVPGPQPTTKADEYMKSWASGDESKVRIPGGKNYRELVLMVPEEQFHPPPERIDVQSLEKEEDLLTIAIDNEKQLLRDEYIEETGDTEVAWGRFTDWMDDLSVRDRRLKLDETILDREVVKEEIKKALMGTDTSPRFPGEKGHYPEDNVIMHIRINERIDEDGRKVLFVEELQSDWGQAGQKEGFKGPKGKENINELKKKVDELEQKVVELESYKNQEEYNAYVEINKQFDDAYMELTEAKRLQASGFPEGPFVMDTNTWTALGLKRLVRWATDNDYDAIAWTTPKQQSRRYDSQVYPKSIFYYPNMKRLETDDYISSQGSLTTKPIRIEDVEVEDLPGFIGEEAAAALLSEKTKGVNDTVDFHQLYTTSPGWVRKEGNKRQIELATKGHQKFYDKLMLNQARALADEYGGTVKKMNVIESPAIQKINKKIKAIEDRIDVNKQSIVDLQYEESDRMIQIERRDIVAPTMQGTPEQITKMLEEHVTELEADRWELLDELSLEPNYADEKQWTWELTPKLKKAAKDGLPYYVALPPIYAGTKAAQQEDYDQDLTSRAAGRAAYVQ